MVKTEDGRTEVKKKVGGGGVVRGDWMDESNGLVLMIILMFKQSDTGLLNLISLVQWII